MVTYATTIDCMREELQALTRLRTEQDQPHLLRGPLWSQPWWSPAGCRMATLQCIEQTMQQSSAIISCYAALQQHQLTESDKESSWQCWHFGHILWNCARLPSEYPEGPEGLWSALHKRSFKDNDVLGRSRSTRLHQHGSTWLILAQFYSFGSQDTCSRPWSCQLIHRS